MSNYDSDFEQGMKKLKWAAIGLLSFFGLWLILHCIQSVPVGSRGVITFYGKIETVVQEGPHFISPLQSLTVFNIRAEAADIKDAEGVTNEQQPVSTSLTVRYNIDPAQVEKVFEQYSHNGDLSSYIETASQETFKAVTARYSAVDLISKRADVSAAIRSLLEQKVKLYGANIINIDMTKFAFSPSYMDAIHKKVEQEQLLQVAENKVKTIQAEAQQEVVQAQAAATAQRAKADGDAYEKRTNADAEAYSLTAQQKALAASPQILELKRIEVAQTWAEKWDGSVPTIVMGQSSGTLPYLNLSEFVQKQPSK